MPSFTTFDLSTLILTVKTNGKSFAGTYSLDFVASLNPNLRSTSTFTLKLTLFPYPNTDAPKFAKILTSPITLALGAEIIVPIPKVKDADDDSIETSLWCLESKLLTQSIPGFITYDSTNSELTLKPTDEQYLGTHNLIFNLTDLNMNPKTRLVPFDVIVTRYDLKAL